MTTNLVLLYVDSKTNKKFAEVLSIPQCYNLKNYSYKFDKAEAVSAFKTKKEAANTAQNWNETANKDNLLMTADEYTAFVYGK